MSKVRLRAGWLLTSSSRRSPVLLQKPNCDWASAIAVADAAAALPGSSAAGALPSPLSALAEAFFLRF